MKSTYSVYLASYFRWAENKKVALQLIEVWDAVKKRCKFLDTLLKSKHAKFKSYVTLGMHYRTIFLLLNCSFLHLSPI